MGKDVVEESTTQRILEDDTDVLVRFDDVVQSNDVRVFESLKEEVDAKPPKGFQQGRTKRRDDKENDNAP